MNIRQKILDILQQHVPIENIRLEVPPDLLLGDYALPCFTLASVLKQSPHQIAQDLSRKIPVGELIERVDVKGAYVNIFLNKRILAQEVIEEILSKKKRFGSLPDKGRRVIIEYFHANTHKGVHIGHIRNICMGEALCRLLEKSGVKVIRANFQGDIGPHVAKCIWGYLHHKGKEPKANKGVWLGKIYAMAHQKAEESDLVAEEIQEINNRLYARDEKVMKVWRKTRQYCLKDFEKLYKDFGVRFDRLYFESETEERGKQMVLDLVEKGIAQRDDGAVIIDLKKDNLGVFVLLTKEGHALYSTKDIGLAQIKNEEYGDVDESLHLVGVEQQMHFKQLFRTLEIMDHAFGKKSKHLSYGLVMLPEGKMSSRDGTMVLYEDLFHKLVERVTEEISKRRTGLNKKELEHRQKNIALAALKFSMINRDFNKEIIFDWEKALSFEGETGPYLQYTCARINSIFRKHGKNKPHTIDYRVFNDMEIQLAKRLFTFPEVIETAAEQHKPSLLCRYLLDLAQHFNEYYHAYPILQENQSIQNARLVLTMCIKEVIGIGLEIVGIKVLEEM